MPWRDLAMPIKSKSQQQQKQQPPAQNCLHSFKWQMANGERQTHTERHQMKQKRQSDGF
uniref:MIP36802p1 n=1 Tax=Drosophila melanogaster TaxID=7227 RepID=R9U2W4_DROME|nr:MIP36802p1 [Drosophila melanogaster]